MSVQFNDYRIQVTGAMDEAALQFLEEAASSIQSQAENNTPVDTGQLKGSWDHKIDEGNKEAVIGNPLEYAIWIEMGTGEFAVEGNGRRGGWSYVDADGNRQFTYGTKPRRMLHNAFQTLKNPITEKAKQVFGERLK